MKQTILTKIALPIIAVISMTACGTNSIPNKGYKKFKEQTAQYYKSIGGTGKEVKFSSCSYVWITGSGTLDVGNLKDTVWYTTNYTVTIGSSSLSKRTCFEYSSTSDYVQELSDSKGYSYAYSLVQDGSLKGKIGSL